MKGTTMSARDVAREMKEQSEKGDFFDLGGRAFARWCRKMLNGESDGGDSG